MRVRAWDTSPPWGKPNFDTTIVWPAIVVGMVRAVSSDRGLYRPLRRLTCRLPAYIAEGRNCLVELAVVESVSPFTLVFRLSML